MKKIDRKISLIIFVVVIILVTALRFYQWSSAIDLDTGFFKGSTATEMAMIISVVVGTVLFAIPVLFGASKPKKEGDVSAFDADSKLTAKRTSVVFASISMMICLFIIWDLVSNFTGIAGFGALKYILLILELCSAVVFGITAVMQYINKPFLEGLGFSYLIPTMWFALRAAQLFKNSTALTSNSQNLIKMMFLLSAILFFVYFARYRAGFSKRRTKETILITGMLTAVFSITMVVPLFVFGGSIAFEYSNDLLGCDLCVGAFAICTIVRFFGKDYKKIDDENEAEIENSSDFNTDESFVDETDTNQ